MAGRPATGKTRKGGKGAPAKDAELPAFAGIVAARHPALWEAYGRLGEAAAAAGPLTAREQRLVKLALSLGAGSQGSAHSHARRALAEGIAGEALEQVALLAITSLGWAQAMRGLAWIEDVTRNSSPARAQAPSARRARSSSR